MYELERDEVGPIHAIVIMLVIAALFTVNLVFKMIDISSPVDYGRLIRGLMMFGSLAVIVFSFVRFRFSILVFIFIAPLAVHSLPGIPFFFTYGDAYIIILVLVWFFRMVFGHEQVMRGTILDRLIFIFVALSLFSIINSRDTSAAFRELIQTLEYFVFCYYLFVMAINRRSMLNAVIYAVVACGALVSIYGILQYGRMGGHESRIVGTFGHFNAMGAFLSMMIVFSFNLAITEKDRRARIFFYAALVLNVLAILLTFSRGAWIAVILGIVVSAWIRGMAQFLKIFTIVVGALAIMSVVAPPRYIARLATVPKIEDMASKNRLRQWEIAYETITTYPLLGVGLTSNGAHVTEKYDEPASGEIHNLFLHIGSERGLPAMVVLLSIFGLFYVNCIRRISRTEDPFYHSIYVALFAALVAFGVVNLFAYQFIRGLGLFFAMFLGMYSAAVYIEENEPGQAEWADMLSTLEVKRPRLEMGM